MRKKQVKSDSGLNNKRTDTSRWSRQTDIHVATDYRQFLGFCSIIVEVSILLQSHAMSLCTNHPVTQCQIPEEWRPLLAKVKCKEIVEAGFKRREL